MAATRSSKVTVHPSPGDEPKAAPPSPQGVSSNQDITKGDVVLVDSAGKRITLREPGPNEEYDFILAVGAEAAENSVFMQTTGPIRHVVDIDGDPIMPPASLAEFRVIVGRLGTPGKRAVLTWYMTNVMVPMMAAVEEAKKGADKARQLAVKK